MKILVSRKRGGWGDIIAVEPAIRAVRVRFPHAYITFAVTDPWFPFCFDQKRSVYGGLGPDDVIWPDPWDAVTSEIMKKVDIHFELDGPEMRHQLDSSYELTQSRIESWVKYVDCMPDDMCPRWHSTSNERQKVISWLNEVGIKPFEFILIQWTAAERKKDYPYMEELANALKGEKLPVVVCHNGIIPKLDVFEAVGWTLRDVGCLTQIAGLVIGPDSFMQHLAAAVRTPSLGIFGPTNPELYLKHYPLARHLWYTDVTGRDCVNTFPCYGIQARSYWCTSRPRSVSWCMEQIKVETVVDSAYSYYEELVEREFYKEKADSLASDGSSLFYFPDPRVNLIELNAVHTTRTIGSRIRNPILAERKPCQ